MTTASTSLAELKQNTAPPVIKPGDDAKELGFFNGASFALTSRVANMFSQSTLVPKHYQGNIANCMIALNMANRLGADPLMVMQNLYVVHGTPAWSAQFLIATFNMCGRFSALRYRMSGERGTDDYGCTAYAVETGTGATLEGTTITIGLAKKEGWHGKPGSKWQTMPDQMLRYRAASWFVRAYAPEIAMGLHTAEEMYDMSKNEAGVYEIDGPAVITMNDIKNGGVIDVEAQPADDTKSGSKEKAKPKPETKASKNDSQTEAEAKGNEAPITRQTLDEIENQLKRLGSPSDQLPPDLASDVGTGDPSELTEDQGKLMIVELMKMKS